MTPGCVLGIARSRAYEKGNIMDQLLRLTKRLKESNLCTERDEMGYFCSLKRPCPIHETAEEQKLGESPLTSGDSPQAQPDTSLNGGKDCKK